MTVKTDEILFRIGKPVDGEALAKTGSVRPELIDACRGKHLRAEHMREERYAIDFGHLPMNSTSALENAVALINTRMELYGLPNIAGMDFALTGKGPRGEGRGLIALDMAALPKQDKDAAVILALNALDSIKPKLFNQVRPVALMDNQEFGVKTLGLIAADDGFTARMAEKGFEIVSRSITTADDPALIVKEKHPIPVFDAGKIVAGDVFIEKVREATAPAFTNLAWGENVNRLAERAISRIVDGKSLGDHTVTAGDIAKAQRHLRETVQNPRESASACLMLEQAFHRSPGVNHELEKHTGVSGAVENLKDHPVEFFKKALSTALNLSDHTIDNVRSEGRKHSGPSEMGLGDF